MTKGSLLAGPAPRLHELGVNPFHAAHLLSKGLSFNLTCFDPLVFDGAAFTLPSHMEQPDGLWGSNAVQRINMDRTGASIREALGLIFNQQRGWYWIATPADRTLLPRMPSGTNMVLLAVHRAEQGLGSQVLERRTQKYLEDQHRTRLAWQARLLRLGLPTNATLMDVLRVEAERRAATNRVPQAR